MSGIYIEETGIFRLRVPELPAGPVMFNAPHSGDVFPEAFLARAQLGRETLRRASDLYVDAIIEPLVNERALVMSACLPRSYLDLNREPLELDPRLIEGPLPLDANTRSLRVVAGLGTIPRVIGDGIEIYAGKLTLDEVVARIEGAYLPYHRKLRSALAELHAEHGQVLLIDCHSMPSSLRVSSSSRLVDIVIGDRFGTSAHPDLVEMLEQLFRTRGFSVLRNQPYAGAYITECYGRPAQGWHAVQVEINRALIMDERTLQPLPSFARIAEELRAVFTTLLHHEPFSEPFKNRISDLHFYQKAAE